MTTTGYANPHLICGDPDCGGWVTATTNGANVPCGHEAGVEDVCPPWSPVDGCLCIEHFGRREHGEPPTPDEVERLAKALHATSGPVTDWDKTHDQAWWHKRARTLITDYGVTITGTPRG